ncbi:MAG: helix-turn-helix transcriptional regulator [Hoeflea sp.]|nr:helix-turn-helix transcriptional regulator [Hoeflea sp.]
MTPFGEAIRRLRAERGITQRQMASALGVSPAYLSALEHGNRSEPSWEFVQRVIGYFNIIWDEAEELQMLAGLSRPKVVINTSGLTPKATEVANKLATAIGRLDAPTLQEIEALIDRGNFSGESGQHPRTAQAPKDRSRR